MGILFVPASQWLRMQANDPDPMQPGGLNPVVHHLLEVNLEQGWLNHKVAQPKSCSPSTRPQWLLPLPCPNQFLRALPSEERQYGSHQNTPGDDRSPGMCHKYTHSGAQTGSSAVTQCFLQISHWLGRPLHHGEDGVGPVNYCL